MPGQIIYRGPSLLDGQPIVVVALTSSSNRKTGNMVQTGKAHNGTSGQAKDRTCYVLLAQGPLMVWKGLQKDAYPVAQGHAAISAIGKGRMVRIGTYGDGAAVPSYIWDSLCHDAKGWTAYTHQSQWAGAAADPARFMVSVESKTEATAAWNHGARTFRVIADARDIVPGREVLCPASEEAGKRTTCDKCKLCAGASLKAKSIAIVAHGTAKNKAKAVVAHA